MQFLSHLSDGIDASRHVVPCGAEVMGECPTQEGSTALNL